MVSVDQLRAVRAIADTGSITAAAKRLGMSQPGLSRLVERVEEQLDADLFLRGRSGAELTEAGRRVLQFAQSTVVEYETLLAAVGGTRGRLQGSEFSAPVVRIVASTTPGEYLLPHIASGFARAHRGVSVDTLITDSAAVTALLLSGDFDVGFCGRMRDGGTLRYMTIARDEIVLAVPAAHPFAALGEVRASQLEGERMLRRERGSGTYNVVLSVLEESGQSLPEQTTEITLGSTQAVLQAVDAGLGIGFVTIRAIEQHAPSRVVPVRITGAPVLRDLFLAYQPDRPMPDTVATFIRFVEDWVKTEENDR